MGRWREIVLVGLIGASTGCSVPRPKPEALAAFETGFQTPEGAFESLRTAFQAEVLDWEYRCFSKGFTDANDLSQLSYRAFRPQLLAQIPRLRWALARAEVETVELLDERTALLRARVPVPFRADPILLLRLVREEWGELSVLDEFGEVVVAEAVTPDVLGDLFDPAQPRMLTAPDAVSAHGLGLIWLALDVGPEDPISAEQLREGFTRLVAAREWKIDQIGLERPD